MYRPTCPVCTHPQVALIEENLQSGETIQATLKRWGLSAAVLTNHHKNHMERDPAQIARLRTAEDIMSKVETMLDELDALYDNLLELRKFQDALAVRAEQRKWLTMYARLICAPGFRQLQAQNQQVDARGAQILVAPGLVAADLGDMRGALASPGPVQDLQSPKLPPAPDQTPPEPDPLVRNSDDES